MTKFLLLPTLIGMTAGAASAETTATISIRGHAQTLRLYGQRGGLVAIVASGDGGWIHLAPHVAETLATHGFFVVGFDVKAYLESFTTTAGNLSADDVQRDFRVIVDFARDGAIERPILVGVSEGAGLSVLAAADAVLQRRIAGVLGLGLPDVNELAWRWRDSVVYVTHGVPHEPTFRTSNYISKITVPIAAVHSDRDEFVPVPEIQRLMSAAHEPKRLWIVHASDHRFSNNIRECDSRLFEGINWIYGHETH